MPESWNSPWIVPSSPFLPWRAGKIASRGITWAPVPPKATRPWTVGSGDKKAGVTGPRSHAPVVRSSTGPVYSSHFPVLVMPTMVTSYFSGSRFWRMEVADMRDTSCSEDWPPKITASRSFSPLVFIRDHIPILCYDLAAAPPGFSRTLRDIYYTIAKGKWQAWACIFPFQDK